METTVSGTISLESASRQSVAVAFNFVDGWAEHGFAVVFDLAAKLNRSYGRVLAFAILMATSSGLRMALYMKILPLNRPLNRLAASKRLLKT
jgi:hypothetical protein